MYFMMPFFLFIASPYLINRFYPSSRTVMTHFTSAPHPLIRASKISLNILAASLLCAFGSGHAQEAAPASAARTDAASLKPFSDVLKDSKEMKGFFTLHRKDEKVWLEIRPEQLEKPFFFTVNVTNGIGERQLYGSQMGRSQTAYFRRIGNQVQLLAKNMAFTATANTPQAAVVAQGFSDSLLASSNVISAPNAETKAFLIDANALLFADIPAYATRLEVAFRQPFALDSKHTSFTKVRADDNLTGLQVNAHYAVPKLIAPPLTPPTTPQPSPPTTLPDARSMFFGFYYSFAALSNTPMAPRIADDRIGHFVTTQNDYTEDLSPKVARHFVNRWRLEKQDPNAPLSEPVKPITYWLDKNIPEKYRQAVTDGALEWNLAFERIGFKNAIVVKQQTEQDDFDTLDANHASIRWFVGADVGFAIGPSKVDLRSGEILDADIGMSDVFARGARRFIGEDQTTAAHSAMHTDCNYSHEAGNEMDFAFDLLETRGELEMNSPKAEALAQAYVKDVIMHEVGHTLGLRHNFRSSTIYTLQQLASSDFTKKNGMAGSVMDYTPFNVALKGEPQGEYVMSTLGPYDYWAVEYAYKPIASANESAELKKIAARSTEPLLTFGTDEDSTGYLSDPEINVFDLGSDPLAFAKKRLALTRELWNRLETKQLKTDESFERLRRSFEYGFNQFVRAAAPVGKYIGGHTFLRDHAGTGRPTFTPIAVERQREALGLLTSSLFRPDSFKLSPELVSRLGVDHFEDRQKRDISISDKVLALQSGILDQLMSDPVAHRLIDSQEKVADSKKVLALAELYDTLQAAIWSELKAGKDISAMRRNLQREHMKRMANVLIRPAPSTPADARSLLREKAVQLQKEIQLALGKPINREAKAHLSESLNSLNEALKASVTRTGI